MTYYHVLGITLALLANPALGDNMGTIDQSPRCRGDEVAPRFYVVTMMLPLCAKNLLFKADPRKAPTVEAREVARRMRGEVMAVQPLEEFLGNNQLELNVLGDYEHGNEDSRDI